MLYAIKRDFLWLFGALVRFLPKIKVLTQKMRKLWAFSSIFETDRQTLWLKEVMYAIIRDLLGFIGSCKKTKDLN